MPSATLSHINTVFILSRFSDALSSAGTVVEASTAGLEGIRSALRPDRISFTARDTRKNAAVLLPGSRLRGTVPIEYQGDIHGAFMLTFEHPRTLTDDDISLARFIAQQTGLCIHSLKQEKRCIDALAGSREAQRLRDEFIAMVVHELQGPLTGVVGGIYAIRAGAYLEGAVDLIDRSAKAEARIIEDLMDLIRLDSQKLQLSLSLIDLTRTVRESVEGIELTAKKRKVALRVAYEDLPIMVRADAGRLQQVLWNLLSNAIRFAPAGGYIEVRVFRQDDDAEVTIRDNGAGIRPEFLPFVFDRFRQGPFGNGKHRGLGLGLAIVRELVEMHGGSVRADSPGLDQGSTLTVRLPCHTGSL